MLLNNSRQGMTANNTTGR